MSSEKHITYNAGRMAAGTTLSRVLGYLRDMAVAHAFGAGFFADAFYAAFRIPNLLRRLLGEGSLSAAFIPVLSQYFHTKSKEETQELINVVFTTLALVLAAVTALGILFAPQIVNIIAFGFTRDPEKLALTVTLTRLMFPFLMFVCLAAFLLGVANTFNSFFVPAVAPASLSIAEIGFIMGIAPLLDPESQIRGLAISVIVGGFLQFVVQWPQIRKLGWALRFKVNFKHPAVKQIGLLMLPSMVGLSVDQVNAFVSTILATMLEQGSITALYYSNRIMQLPLAIFGLALSTAALPAMSKCASCNDVGGVKDALNYSTRQMLFILVPSAVGLMVVGTPIISALFERGEFTRRATLMTSSALFFFASGLPAYAIAKVYAGGFYAFQDTKTPVYTAMAAMVLNVILSIILMRPLGVGGLALATAMSSYFNAAVLCILLRRRLGILGLRRAAGTLAKTLIASAAMGAVSYWLAYILFPSNPLFGAAAAITAGALVYAGMSFILGMEEKKPLIAMLSSRFASARSKPE